MKHLFYFLAIALFIISCGTSNKITDTSSKNKLEEAVIIENDSLEYQIIIYDIGFSSYLHTIAKPQNFYSQDYYETKNIFYISEWNNRARNPLQYGDFYGSIIDYDQNIDYGIEVNYKLYSYFQFIKYKHGIRLR
ncbi:MAG: DUF6146 family protein [Flavobacteriaceae bacterium]|nr:DUF6146 family protein [Flavobacteriaceae bacterium]